MEKLENEFNGTRFYLDIARLAFNLSSSGMGIHLRAVELLTAGKELPEFLLDSVKDSSSNYLGDPYINSWEDSINSYHRIFAPKSHSRYFPSHLKLLKTMREEYNKIDNQKRRYLFGGNQGLVITDNPSAPIERREIPTYVRLASESGLIDIPEGLDTAALSIDINDRNLFGIKIQLRKAGILFKPEVDMISKEIDRNQIFRKQTQKAAVYKLGAMLGVSEQLSTDAAQQGHPIPANFQPEDPDRKMHAAWRRLVRREMPTFQELYRHAHSKFVEVADSTDPVISYLFPLKDLPLLVT